MKLHTESAVREAIHLLRIARQYKQIRKGHKNEGKQPFIIILFDNVYFTVVSGWGSIFDNFVQYKTLGDYSGKYFGVRNPEDDDYRTARVRYLPFDRCFSFGDDDVTDRKFNNQCMFICRNYHTLYV